MMWRMGILNSYTMESTFGGSTLGSKTYIHFTTEDLKSLGYHVCDTLRISVILTKPSLLSV